MAFDSTRIPKIDFDWQASLKLMDNRESVVHELAAILRDDLPDFNTALQSAFQKNDTQSIRITAHKLHGGLCYISAPRLKYLISNLEAACKKHPEDISSIASYIGPSIDSLYTILKKTIT